MWVVVGCSLDHTSMSHIFVSFICDQLGKDSSDSQ